ncbi:GNAT family N-acetyltransferase [Demequina aurantiaca]|uniref:GNAT family N-acetyltransferase n=1 Tax=Demequina aurantiaca TaxID=676200 RepID=UPI000784B8CC|nr:GNAT family protein [Demequina aurantiaca]
MTFSETPLLENRYVRLEPLVADHAAELNAAASVGELWRTWYTSIPAPDAMAGEIERRLSLQHSGAMAPWAIVNAQSGRAVGMTTYMNIDEPNRRLEIGHTWLGKESHGTGINASAKLLLLTRAFEDLDCIAVEFRTHWHNHQSRAAIARLGAKQDGVLRNHQVLRDGSLRDTVVFSLIASEWPAARNALEARVQRAD